MNNSNPAGNRRIAKNTLFLYFRMILIMGVNLYTSRIVLNTLGVVDYGVYNVVGGVVAMFAFLNSALAQATQRFVSFGIKSNTVAEQKVLFSMLLNIHILIAFVVILSSETIGLWFLYNKLVIPEDRLFSAFIVMQSSICISAISITQVPYNASIFGHEKMDVYAYLSVIEALLKLVAVIALTYFFYDKLVAYALLLLTISFIIASLYRYYCKRVFENCHYVRCWSKKIFKEVISYTSWSLIGNLAWTMNGQGMNILINMFFGPIFNAARGIAAAVETAVTSFLYNFTGAAVPQIIKKYAEGDYNGMRKLSFESSKFGFLLFMCLSVPLISVMSKLLEIWLTTPPPISDKLCILSLIYIQVNSMGGTMQNVVQATGNVKNFQLSNGVIKLVPLPMVYLLYRYGAPVTSYLFTLIFISFIGLFVQLYVVNRQVPFFSKRAYLKQVIFPELLSYSLPICFALSLNKYSFNIIESVSVFLFMIATCIISSWFIGLNMMERKWIYDNFIRKIYKKFI